MKWLSKIPVGPRTHLRVGLVYWVMNAAETGLSHFLRVRDGACVPNFWRTRTSGLLDVKLSQAVRALDSCDLCPHHCHVNRNAGETGFCGVQNETAVHWEGILHGEEAELVPSHEMFLSGCTMRCAFCYSHEHILRPMSGRVMTPLQMADCTQSRRREGATNWNLVGGEPTVHIPNILRALRELSAPVPIVWNSNMYATATAMDLLDGVVDLFLGDIHFGNDACARRLAHIPDYLVSLTLSFSRAVASGASVIIRHLVLPGHLHCCTRPALQWAKTHFPDTLFHLMFQYIPDWRTSNDPILGRRLTEREKREAAAMAADVGVRLYTGGDDGPHPPAPSPALRERGSGKMRQVLTLSRSVGEGGAKSLVTNAPGEGSGEPPVTILIHPNGEISFTRLTGELVPVAAVLGGSAS